MDPAPSLLAACGVRKNTDRVLSDSLPCKRAHANRNPVNQGCLPFLLLLGGPSVSRFALLVAVIVVCCAVPAALKMGHRDMLIYTHPPMPYLLTAPWPPERDAGRRFGCAGGRGGRAKSLMP